MISDEDRHELKLSTQAWNIGEQSIVLRQAVAEGREYAYDVGARLDEAEEWRLGRGEDFEEGL
ncbi:hypothetical protein BU17DRAFT_103620 [Hysterangium stoloniferum]|nr:hypothetical protein BU17DRAFT_103620 [Hysterangium stoloniferum]